MVDEAWMPKTFEIQQYESVNYHHADVSRLSNHIKIGFWQLSERPKNSINQVSAISVAYLNNKRETI
jgi:hypothetical protein